VKQGEEDPTNFVLTRARRHNIKRGREKLGMAKKIGAHHSPGGSRKGKG